MNLSPEQALDFLDKNGVVVRRSEGRVRHNPRPDGEIKSIDMVYGAQARGVPVLIAVTTARRVDESLPRRRRASWRTRYALGNCWSASRNSAAV